MPTDRTYWEKRTSKKMMENIDKIYNALGEIVSGFELKYNKFYIGLSKDGISRNFLMFRPKKSFLYIVIKTKENNPLLQEIENDGLEINYTPRWNECKIKLDNFETYNKHKEIINKIILSSKSTFNLID